MTPLYTEEEFNNSKSHDKLAIKCELCGNIGYKWKSDIKKFLNGIDLSRAKFCTKKCMDDSKITRVRVNCTNCNKDFEKQNKKLNKNGRDFCTKSCAVTYNNTHKTTGNRRSKLEIWLEEKITILYPNLEICFNKKDAIDSELDIYISSLNLAFELNGLFHYEPIFGNEKFQQIKNNDNRKFQACLERNIELCIIDSSSLKYFKDKNCQKYLDIIKDIIDTKIKCDA